jgi:hypothetical protein
MGKNSNHFRRWREASLPNCVPGQRFSTAKSCASTATAKRSSETYYSGVAIPASIYFGF